MKETGNEAGMKPWDEDVRGMLRNKARGGTWE